jgi:hypothetical protein
MHVSMASLPYIEREDVDLLNTPFSFEDLGGTSSFVGKQG